MIATERTTRSLARRVVRATRDVLVLAAAMTVAAGAMHATAATIAPDDARESRWADEVVPQVVVGDPVWLQTPHRARVLALYAPPAGDPKGAVIVVHGLGVHPDWTLIGDIRGGLADRGFATLALQMPVLAADAPREQYAALAPFAAERLDAALAWLHAHGQARVAVLSHSMGATMVNAWMTSSPKIDAWVPLGMLVPFARPPRMPVLDVVGESDYPDALGRVPAAATLPADGCSRSITIARADHFMQGAVPRMLDAITPFLARALAGGCRIDDARSSGASPPRMGSDGSAERPR
jgi:dienelactone hydrolase